MTVMAWMAYCGGPGGSSSSAPGLMASWNCFFHSAMPDWNLSRLRRVSRTEVALFLTASSLRMVTMAMEPLVSSSQPSLGSESVTRNCSDFSKRSSSMMVMENLASLWSGWKVSVPSVAS